MMTKHWSNHFLMILAFHTMPTAIHVVTSALYASIVKDQDQLSSNLHMPTKKRQIFMNARNLRGMESWTGVTIAHDLTKMEYQEEQIQESILREKVGEMNQNLSVEEKRQKIWKIVGGQGCRPIACFCL